MLDRECFVDDSQFVLARKQAGEYRKASSKRHDEMNNSKTSTEKIMCGVERSLQFVH